MKPLSRLGLNSEIAVRILADTIMVNAALLIALLLCSLAVVDLQKGIVLGSSHVVSTSLRAYTSTFWLLTVVILSVF